MRGVLPPFRTTAGKNILHRQRAREFSNGLFIHADTNRQDGEENAPIQLNSP
jgi:hypothetical protein